MVIQIHQKVGDLGERSTHTTYDWNEELEEDKEEENVQATEPETQGLADKGERIPGIVEGMEKEDQDAQIMEQCGDSSDGKNDERFPVLGEWREEVLGIQWYKILDVRSLNT